jgi:RNA polymerase sigma-54 factor
MFEMAMLPEMSVRVTPAMLNLAQLLSLPSLDLQQLVEQELSENPALEETETYETPCPRCGALVTDGFCVQCADGAPPSDGTLLRRDDELDPLLFVAAPRSLSEALLDDLYASLPVADQPIALALVGNLDDHGFLADEPELIAELLELPLERVLFVLERLRELGPPGIATSNPQECLLAQIDLLAAQGVHCPYARQIIADHFEDLGAGRFKQIARRLHISSDEFDTARSFIRRQLWPYPAQAAMSESAPPQRTRYRTADLAISLRDDQFMVEVLQAPRRVLRLNPIYQDLARHAANLPEDERAHVQEYIARARLFLSNLRQRDSTLQRIGEAIVARQEPFLRHGVRHLAPMTRAEIAAELGLHESTISRAAADKTILLPNGALLPLSELFVSARGVQDVLRELIVGEQRPLSDEHLASMLAERGYPIARRTVAKYRDQMKIPPSHLR